MEAIGILIVGGLIICVFVLPIAAFVRSGSARRELEATRVELQTLTRRLTDLEQRLAAGAPKAPADETATPAGVAATTPSAEAGPTLGTASLDAFPAATQRAPETRAPHTEPPPLLPSEPPPVFAATAQPEPSAPPRIEEAPASPGSRPPPSEARPAASPDWERFMGAKLFAWLGGLALFLAAAYFVKYSFERNLIPPEVRVAFGFLLGIGLVAGGFRLKQKAYAVTSQTLCATGVVILYAVTFACRAVYHFAFFGPLPTFLLMTLITAAAFLLAVRMEAMVVAILGMLGGFLTPVLLSTGQDNPLGLFTYIALLDVGLIAVALWRPWAFLVALAALGTLGMQAGWSLKFFTAEKIATALIVFLGFDLLFLGGWEAARRRTRDNAWWRGAAAGVALATMVYAISLLTYTQLGQKPVWLGALVLGADLCLLALVLRAPGWSALPLAGGALAHLFVALWTLRYLTSDLLFWALGLVLAFAVLHSVVPVILARARPDEGSARWAHLFPPAALLLLLIPLLKLETVSVAIWPAILLLDLLAMGLAVATASLTVIFTMLALTALVIGLWIFRIPVDLAPLPLTLIVVAGMAALFVVVGSMLVRKYAAGDLRVLGGAGGEPDQAQARMLAQLPALSAFLPFLLLILITLRLPLANPSPVFALGLALLAVMLVVAAKFEQPLLPAAGLGGVLALELVWFNRWFSPAQSPALALTWLLVFGGLFLAYPFVARRRCEGSTLPWAMAALSLPAHFPLIHRVVKQTWPNDFMGLLPAALALPVIAGLATISRWFPEGHAQRNRLLAWFGGAALLFITLVFPIQFDRQWITLGWALEGLALCWWFRRVPQPGLRLVGVALLCVAFARLALNPAVLGYQPRSATAIFNWYLYAYGTVVAALFVAARLLAPPRDRIGPLPAPALLNTLGTVLAFLLVNIEIADYFTPPGQAVLAFQFSGNFARDMTYTIAWALFALGLVVSGMRWHLKSARYAGLALLGVTLLKLFFHDLGRLAQLYRIGALAAVAVVAILASFLYQRFLSNDGKPPEKPGGLPP